MTKKLDKLSLGLILGIFCPIVCILFLYQIKYNTRSIKEFMEMLSQIQILTKVLSLSIIPNLLLFFIFIWTNKLLSARGVLLSTIIYAFLIFSIKFIV